MPVSRALSLAAIAAIVCVVAYVLNSGSPVGSSGARTTPRHISLAPADNPSFSANIIPRSLSPQFVATDTESFSDAAMDFAGLFSYADAKPAKESNSVLRDYGNALGGAIARFAEDHPNMMETLSKHAQNRADTAAAAALKSLGADYISFSTLLLGVEAPKELKDQHFALSASYRSIGESLQKIATSSTDKEFLDAIQAHNAIADNLAQKLKSLSSVFMLSGITYDDAEPGFMFTGGGM